MEQTNSSDQELAAIIKHTEKYWVGFDKFNSEDFFSSLWLQSTESTKNRFSANVFTDFVEIFSNIQNRNPEKTISINQLSSHNIGINLLVSSMILEDHFSSRENWNFEKTANKILSNLKSEFPECLNIKPIGSKEMKDNYTEHDGMLDFDTKKANKEFAGAYSGTATTQSFPVRISLPYAMHDHVSNRQSPLTILVHAVLGHAYVFNENTNSSKMKAELKIIEKTLEKSLMSSENIEIELSPLSQVVFKLAACENKKESLPEIIKSLDNKHQNKKTM